MPEGCQESKPKLKCTARHSLTVWAEPAMLRVASRRERRVWVGIVGWPEGMHRDVGLEDKDADGDQEKVGSIEKWEHSKKKIYLKQNSPPLARNASCCPPVLFCTPAQIRPASPLGFGCSTAFSNYCDMYPSQHCMSTDLGLRTSQVFKWRIETIRWLEKPRFALLLSSFAVECCRSP